MIINKLTGMHFTKFIEERQFKVVGMKQTRFGDGYDIIPNYAGAYSVIRNTNGQWIKDGGLKNTFIDFPVFFRTATGIDMHESNGFGLPANVKKLRVELLKHGFHKAGSVFAQLKKKDPDFKVSEDELNGWGYKLLEQNQKENALPIFKLNTTLYPQSANVYDSLAEVYELLGNRKEAIRYYSRSLQLNPENTNASAHLKELNKM